MHVYKKLTVYCIELYKKYACIIFFIKEEKKKLRIDQKEDDYKKNKIVMVGCIKK